MRMQRKKNAVLSRDFESKVVCSKRAPAMNPPETNPDPFFSSKSQFLEVVYG
jgi:hypothetical protein